MSAKGIIYTTLARNNTTKHKGNKMYTRANTKHGYKQLRVGNQVTYYDKGYLARQRFYDNNLRDIANFFMRLAENECCGIIPKKIDLHGNVNHDPVFQYIAQKNITTITKE